MLENTDEQLSPRVIGPLVMLWEEWNETGAGGSKWLNREIEASAVTSGLPTPAQILGGWNHY
jgi:hypothetical protein